MHYIIHLIEVIKGGDWHDGYSETHYAYLENTKTNLGDKKMILYTNILKSLLVKTCLILSQSGFIILANF